MLKALDTRAAALGFSGYGVVDLTQHNPNNADWLRECIGAGYHGTMSWMEDTLERRVHPLAMWPEAKSAIVLGYNYGPDNDPLATLSQSEKATISVYARNKDYHGLMKGKLKELASLLARDSGATIIASAPAAKTLRQGHSDADDPQFGQLPNLPAVTGPLRVVKDGEAVRLGKVDVTAVATPGHAAGSTSWRWRSCEAGRCLNIVFASSINPVSVDGYRFSDPAHRAIVATFRQTIARVGALPCDILFTAHPDNSGGDVTFAQFERHPTPNPFIDPAACRKLSASYTSILDARLAREAKPADPQ